MQIPEQINLYIAGHPEWQRKLMVRIRQLVHAASEDVQEAWRGQAPHFDLASTAMVNISASKTSVSIHFPHGAHFKPTKLAYEPAAEDKPGRTIKFHEGDAIPEAAFSALLHKAAAYSLKLDEEEGEGSGSREHSELEAILRKDPSAWVNWSAFGKTERREYSEWVADGRKEETRKRRIAQALEQIREGLTRDEAAHRVKGA
ncbi:MAG: YdeI/OmpD-associated family protein [Bacteroidetes bacterium]|nr:YdeI/OmpD-associated family protein [Bacteroidota bacterium]MBS1939356.1 YdeI/OmpD-associated family protein [Bacteroidota bacterium]